MSTVGLDDKYLATRGRVYVTGPQALVRLPIDQARRDAAAGLRTAGFISGYRGSPLGTYDLALWHAQPQLDAHRVRFEPGVNEDLAATAVWGSQQVPLIGSSRYQGVFASSATLSRNRRAAAPRAIRTAGAIASTGAR